MSSPTVVLDAIAGINAPKELLGQLANAPNSLSRLAAGLGFLYGKVRHAELILIDQMRDSVIETLERLGDGVSQGALDSCNSGAVQAFVYGNDPLLNSVRQDLIECAFHWYSVSADNFVRVIWSLSDGSEDRDVYRIKVLGQIVPFRDKIAAHFAGATANKRDNDAERLVSLIPQLAWSKDRLVVGPWTMGMTRSGKHSSSAEIQPWSLTERHEELCERYPILQAFMPTFERRSEQSEQASREELF
jgi:hypothetical protein